MRKKQFFTICLSILLVLVGFCVACAGEYGKYKVKKGDNFTKISKNLKVSLTEFKKLNRDRLKFANNFDLIFPGQVFLIPASKTFKKEAKIVPLEKVVKNDAGAVSVAKVAKKEISKVPAVRVSVATEEKKLPVVASNSAVFSNKQEKKVSAKDLPKDSFAVNPASSGKHLQEEVAKTAVVFPSQLEKEIITKNSQQGYDPNETLDERRDRVVKGVIKVIVPMVTFAVFLTAFLSLYPHFSLKRQSVLVPDIEKPQDIEEFFAEIGLPRKSENEEEKAEIVTVNKPENEGEKAEIGIVNKKENEGERLVVVGYLERGENNKGYFLLDLSGNGSVDIVDIKTLAEVAIEGYKESVKSGIDYSGLMSPEMISRWGAEEGEARPLLQAEIMALEENFSLLISL